MSRVEGDVELAVSLRGLAPEASAKPLSYVRTTRSEDARLVDERPAADGTLRVIVPEGAILTLTTLRPPGRAAPPASPPR
jgi:hypothetical protein